jgi:hypothetical protein
MWKWDLSAQGSPAICTFSFCAGTGYHIVPDLEYSIDGSNDDSVWTTIVDVATMLAYNTEAAIPVSSPVAYQYIRLNFHHYHDASGGWYWGGTDPGLVGLAMWKMAP